MGTATARLYLARIINGSPGSEVEATYSGKAKDGNIFRYDRKDNQYIYNLSTKDLASGTWQLRIALDDGTSKCITINLK